MNLFKILFLCTFIIGLDYHGGAQNCQPDRKTVSACAKAETSTSDNQVSLISTESPQAVSSEKETCCIPADCPPLCKVLCQSWFLAKAFLEPTKEDKVSEGNLALQKLPARHTSLPKESVALE